MPLRINTATFASPFSERLPGRRGVAPGSPFVTACLEHERSFSGRTSRPGQRGRLALGFKLGPYLVEGHIGAGGMGEVFQATDYRLHRTVAIKVLSAEKFSDPEHKRRFLQEARIVSALNHPNIVVLYDISSIEASTSWCWSMCGARPFKS